MTTTLARLGANPPNWKTQLDALRRELQAERSRILVTLKDVRDKLCHIDRLSDATGVRDLILAFEIVITIAERETFADMASERIPVVLRQLEIRLLRLQTMLHDARSKDPSHARDGASHDPQAPAFALH